MTNVLHLEMVHIGLIAVVFPITMIIGSLVGGALTFIAGVYGMNFQYMPELGWQWGYFGILSIMLFVGILLVIFFKRKKWL